MRVSMNSNHLIQLKISFFLSEFFKLEYCSAVKMNNNAFISDSVDNVCSLEGGLPKNSNGFVMKNGKRTNSNEVFSVESTDTIVSSANSEPQRENWGKSIEFLMSCIAMSVGLGNVWRFPFTALENGGGAFLLPYLIVLAVIGRPLYFLEMIIGQFSSRNSIDVYDLSPMFRGRTQYGFLRFFSSHNILCVTCMFNSFQRSWIWSIDCYFFVEHILCIDNGFDRTIFI